MKGCSLPLSLLQVTTLFCLVASQPTVAQIVPDATLPNNSTVQLQDTTNIIEGGTPVGGNLFHSFQEFSIFTGSEAFLNNALNVQNIFSRVTGSSISNIDGLIRTNGTANLFLLNPNGIIFGPNAQLNIGGSFLASTASSFQFADGTQFSATNPQTLPLLTISVPVGLQYGGNAGRIVNQANAITNSDGFPLGLQVPTGRSIALVGGDVALEGGGLNAPGGRIELGGLAAEGTIGLAVEGNILRLNFPLGSTLGNVSLAADARVSVRDTGGGNIVVNANNLTATNGGRLVAGTQGLGNAGDIIVNANNISLSGVGASENGTGFSNQVISGASGNAGNILVNTGSLSLTNGAQLNAYTSGQGNAGRVSIQATDSVSLSNSQIFNDIDPGAVGNSGGITITAGSLSLTDGAQLITDANGLGNAGNITIDVRDTVTIAGANQDGFPSAIFSSVGAGAVGDGGNIDIRTGSLSMLDRTQLVASTLGQGNAGSISVEADGAVFLRNSSILSGVEAGGVGNGGRINIQAGSVLLIDGGQLVTTIYRASETLPAGRGNAGNITIVAHDMVTIAGRSSSDVLLFSGLYSRAEFGAVGNGGNIEIQAGSISLLDGASLSTPHFGIQGNAGNISVRARGLVLLSNSNISSFLGSQSSETVGRGGSIAIFAGSLSMTNRAVLQTSTFGQGDAGSVFIQAQGSVSLTNSNIFSSVDSKAVGNGGDINILAGSLSLKDGAFLSADTNGRGNAGNISVQAKDSVSLTGPVNISFPLASISSGIGQEAEGNGGNIWIQTGSLSLSNASLINSSNLGGRGDAGTISLQVNDSLSLTNRSFISTTVDDEAIGKGGDMNITAGSLLLTNGASLSAATSGQGDAGNISVRVNNSVSLANSSFVNTSVSSPGVGKGGDIDIKAGFLSLTDGSGLGAFTSAQGDAGNISVRVDDLVSLTNGSFIVTNVAREGVGKGGNINITASSLLVSNASFLSAETSGQGNAGDIAIEVSNTISFDGESFASSVVQAEAVGDGGTITVKVPLLSLTNGSLVSVTSAGDGAAGNVIVDAGSVRLDSSLLAAETAAGNQGNIEVRASSLILRNNSRITTNAFRAATGGNITLNTDVLAALENSDISANAQDARGGRVVVNAQAIFGAQPRTREQLQTLLGTDNLDPNQLPTSDITAISQQGGPELQGTVQISTPDIDPSSGLIELPTNLVDATNQFVPECPTGTRFADNEFFITGRGGIAPSPRELLGNNAIGIGWVTLNSQTQRGRDAAGHPHPQTVSVGGRGEVERKERSTTTEITEAQGWVIGAKGEVILTPTPPTPTPHSTWHRPVNCTVPQSTSGR